MSRRLENGHQEGLEGDRLAIDTEAGSATSTQGLANKQTSLPKIARYPDSEGFPKAVKLGAGMRAITSLPLSHALALTQHANACVVNLMQ